MTKYPLAMRLFHWALFIFITANITGGLLMKYSTNALINKSSWYSLHKSIGLCILFLVVIRIINRLFSKIPKFTFNVPKFDRIAAKTNIFLLYCCMLLVPISGYIMSASGAYGVKLFGFQLPDILSKNSEISSFAHEIHGYANYLFIALIIFHFIGSLKHLLIDKINIFKRII